MRSPVLAPAMSLVALTVLMAVSADHQRNAATASPQIEQQAQTQPTPADGVRRVSVEELRAALEKGTAIAVDVRGEEQYKAGRIKGALWIPSDRVASRTKELPKDKLIVFYCS